MFALGFNNSIGAATKIKIDMPKLSCIERAWNFGTFMGDGNSEKEYKFTDYYYKKYCLGTE